jgi:HAD superfamily hydrolase (TIGR01509 family)
MAAVLFDVDGTLVDTTYLHAVTWWRALAQHGHRVPMATIHRAIGMGGDRLLEHLLGAEPEDGDAMRAAHKTLYRECWPQLVQLPGAADLLRACAGKGLDVVLASSADAEELDQLRRVLDADDVVTAATSADDAEASKPAPDIVQIAMAKADAGTDQVVFVGDAVWDVEAAKRAGIPCVALECGGTSAAELRAAGATEVFKGPAELLSNVDVLLR